MLKWLRTTELHTSKVYGMNNPLNGNEPVTKSRDSQELPYELGEKICSLFELPEKYTEDEELVIQQPTLDTPAENQSEAQS